MTPMFRALDSRTYRWWMAGSLTSNVGTWMQRVAQDWLVLTVLTDHSSVAVGITTGLQFLPLLLLAPFAGVVADRVDKRKMLMATQLSMGLVGLALGLLVITDTAQLWHAYLLAFLLGVGAAFDGPVRQAFVSEMVPREHLANAVSLNSASFHAARMIGPGVAGLMIAWAGTGPVFLVNAASFGAVLLSLAVMPTSELHPARRTGREPGQLREGLRYVRARPDLMLIMAIVFVIGTFGLNFQLTTAVMATSVFHKGAQEYGLLGSIMAVGSLAGALLSARRDKPRLRTVIGSTAAFGIFSTLAALMPTYTTFALMLIPVGMSALTLMTTANATVQLSVDPQFRGRVMALYMAIFMGGTPIGSPLIGWVGSAFGARWTILLGGIIALLTAVLAAAWVIRSKQLRVRYRLVQTPHLMVSPRAHHEKLAAEPTIPPARDLISRA